MRGTSVKPIVIAAGGTGGHFFPAEALAAALIARGRRVALMTDARSGSLASPVFAGGECYTLSGAGLAGRSAARATMAGLSLLAGVAQARRILARMDAAAVIGFGGYPSVAPVLAARLLGRRPAVLLHEQNAVLGRANRSLARASDVLALSMAQTEKVPIGVETIVTGNPIRPAVAALAATLYASPKNEIALLILGGSLGARVFSDIVPAAVANLPDGLRSRIRIVQQCRAEDLDRVRAAYTAAGVRAELASFFTDIADRLAAAHLVIARAGASTIAELAAAGRPSILVPLPSAIDDHQSANAAVLVDIGAAIAVPQANFAAASLAGILKHYLEIPTRLTAAAAAARAHGLPHAAARLADLVEARMRQEAAQ